MEGTGTGTDGSALPSWDNERAKEDELVNNDYPAGEPSLQVIDLLGK